MKHRPFSVSTSANWGVAAAFALGLSACAALPANGADSWKEEVLLHDGQKIIVERSQTYRGNREPGQALPVGEHTIRFTPQGSSRQISWTSEYGTELGRTNFNPLALHVKSGTPYLVVEPNLCLSYNKWGRPNPPYLFFKHDGKEWQRVGVSEVPLEFKAINLIVNESSMREIQESSRGAGFVPSDAVVKINENLRQLEYKTIVREAFSNERMIRICQELIFYKGAWVGPGDSIGKRMMDSK